MQLRNWNQTNNYLHSKVLAFCAAFGRRSETCAEVAERRKKVPLAERKPLVLVADDEVIIRETIVEILRGEGYDAVGVKDGAEAVECADQVGPDVFLADVSMPRMNGIDAAKRIKRSLPTTRIICFSGHAATSELLTQAREEGHNFEFLAKPIRPQALIHTIRGGGDLPTNEHPGRKQ
jgi:CheY-like chemotaxis protein